MLVFYLLRVWLVIIVILIFGLMMNRILWTNNTNRTWYSFKPRIIYTCITCIMWWVFSSTVPNDQTRKGWYEIFLKKINCPEDRPKKNASLHEAESLCFIFQREMFFFHCWSFFVRINKTIIKMKISISTLSVIKG